jgi:GNAT superfamily N-acetyltransferase
VKIRQIKKTEYDMLAEFLYHAIFVPPGKEPLPRDVINKPEIAVYINNFGDDKSDCGVVAELDGKIVGAAWTRIIPAYGHIDGETPELAMSVLPEHRNKGIGTKMLKKLFEALAERGYKQASLSVQKENPALRLYERMGYKTVRENDEDFIMVKDLAKERQDYGIAIGISLGMSFGAAVGVLTDNIGFWLPIGLCIGISVGIAWGAVKNKTKE